MQGTFSQICSAMSDADHEIYPAERSVGMPSGIVIERLAVEADGDGLRCCLYDQATRSRFSIVASARSIYSGHEEGAIRRAIAEHLAEQEVEMLT